MSVEHLKQGILIAVEGIDGSGKTTLSHNLFKSMENAGFQVTLTKEPGDTQLGKKIRKIVQTHTVPLHSYAEYLLFAADRAQHFDEIIIPQLNAKAIVISDRLADSSLAYQGYGRQLDCDMINTINKWTMKTIAPDLTLYVRISVEEALERIRKSRALSTFEKDTLFLQRVVEGFETLYAQRNNVIILDGRLSAEKVTEHAIKQVVQWIQKNLSS